MAYFFRALGKNHIMRTILTCLMILAFTTANVSCNNSAEQQEPSNAVLMHRDTVAMRTPDSDMGTEAGRQLFEKKCRDCHGYDGTQLSRGNLQETVLDSLSIAQTIKNGRKDMPGFLDMPDSEVHSITLFVLGLKHHNG